MISGIVAGEAAVASVDPYAANVVLLLKGEGVDDSTTIVDSSPSAHTATIFGDVRISSAQTDFVKSIIYDGSGDAILYPYHADFNLDTSFTLDGWFVPPGSTFGLLFNFGGGVSIAYAALEAYIDSDNTLKFAGSTSNAGYEIGAEGPASVFGTATPDEPNHFAIVYDGAKYYAFLNGVKGYEQTLATHPYSQNPRGLSVGSNFGTTWGTGTPTASFSGYMKNFRLTKGVARWNADFTPPSFT